MYRDNRQNMQNTRMRREQQGLCKTCGGEKERKHLKNCNKCIQIGTEAKQRSRQKLKQITGGDK